MSWLVAATRFALLLLLGFGVTEKLPAADEAPRKTNYDESLVGEYALPDPLVCNDGTKVTDAKTWQERRRPEVLEIFRREMYGRAPAKPTEVRYEVTSTDQKAIGGKGTRKEITIHLTKDEAGPAIHVLLYTPSGAKGASPVVLGMNFDGNHTIHADPGITLHEQWVWNKEKKTAELRKPAESTRGASNRRWELELLLDRGYALATIARANVEPDHAEGWRNGIRGYYLKQSGEQKFADDAWGAIGAWAWSLSRTLDYLETNSDVNAKQVFLTGHSRLGKTALWAGAEDERFAIINSNNSGEGGASLARRNFGETTAVLNRAFPHWFCGNFKKYSNRESDLPMDQHELVALSAPRPVYIASASEDLWADPRGEFLAGKHAEPVYALFGKKGLGIDEPPPVGVAVGDTIAYHNRKGKHDILEFDWKHYLDFADRHFGRRGK